MVVWKLYCLSTTSYTKNFFTSVKVSKVKWNSNSTRMKQEYILNIISMGEVFLGLTQNSNPTGHQVRNWGIYLRIIPLGYEETEWLIQNSWGINSKNFWLLQETFTVDRGSKRGHQRHLISMGSKYCAWMSFIRWNSSISISLVFYLWNMIMGGIAPYAYCLFKAYGWSCKTALQIKKAVVSQLPS